MRKTLKLISLMVIIPIVSFSQNRNVIKPNYAFDFRIGSWSLFWKDKDSLPVVGHSEVTKILNNTVIQENITDTASGIKGICMAVYNPGKNTWHQSWFDNKGGYYSFTGELTENQKVFYCKTETTDEKPVLIKLNYYDVSLDFFKRDWEESYDGGKSWTLIQRILYTRIRD